MKSKLIIGFGGLIVNGQFLSNISGGGKSETKWDKDHPILLDELFETFGMEIIPFK
jgi:hypothetical protein